MLRWLRSLFRFTPIHLRHMGFVREVQGIQKRYRHCKSFWAEHVERCNSLILRTARQCQRKRKAVILGAGLLHDVPLAELSAEFRDVVLVDVVHALGSRWRTRRYPNVTHFLGDVTGCLEAVYEAGGNGTIPLPDSKPTLFLDDDEVDFTVSLNLMSQLPCMPVAYLRWLGGRTEAELEEFARVLIRAHLEYLNRLPGRVLLISDVERLTLDLMGRVTEVRDLLFGLPLPDRDEGWTWKLAPAPEVHPSLSYYRKVVGRVFPPRDRGAGQPVLAETS
jgi:hypothetical protein